MAKIGALRLETAQLLISAAMQEAVRAGLSMAAAVVDSGGHLIAFARMDGVSYMSMDVTRRKAATSNCFRLPTRALAAIADSDPAVAGDLAKNQEICTVGGGIPIIVSGHCVGGLGVGGGRSDQDHAIAEIAVSRVLAEGIEDQFIY